MKNENIQSTTSQKDPLLEAITAGHAALLVSGNIHDFTLVGEEIAYQPQRIAGLLHERGYLVIRYSKSQGGKIHCYSSLTPTEKQAVDSRLNAVGILSMLNRDGQNGSEEIRHFFRGAGRLLQISSERSKPIAVLVDYCEHLAPAVQTSAAAADEQTFVAEAIHMLANAPALRKSGNLLVCLVRDGFQNILLNDMQRITYPFPEEPKTKAFIQTLLSRRGSMGELRYGPLEEGFGEEDLARLTRGLRLREVESMVREAKAQNAPLRRNRVLDAKSRAILNASEGTLSVVSTSFGIDDIVGLETVKRFFNLAAQKLKRGDPTSPRAILMVGPPGTSKSSFAPILANLCRFNIVQFENVKNMFVGESERRLNLALSLVENLSPTILWIDEISETTPSRNVGGSDGGVSLNLLARLLQFSARDDLRGKVLLLAATNVPERLDPAWHDRFVILPFLELLPHEMCQLFGMFERRTTGRTGLDPGDSGIIEASEVLHRKGASPRKILDIVNHAMLTTQESGLTSGDILRAAHDYVGAASPMAVAYCSLVSISLTSFRSYLPWSLNPEKYVYPWYLEGIVDKKTGELDRDLLRKRIEEYRRDTNL